MYHSNRLLRTFAEMLDNIFQPLFEVSLDPSTHPKLHLLLQQVVGFDCVDDESKTEPNLPTPDQPAPNPEQWTDGNPHYAYYCYYLYANVQVRDSNEPDRRARPASQPPPAIAATPSNHLPGAQPSRWIPTRDAPPAAAIGRC